MNLPKTTRRRFLQAGGIGVLNLAVPGLVLGKDKFDPSGKAVGSKKCCIFVLLCGGPSHLDTWDLKPDAPSEIRGPYKAISTKVPGMQLSELHPLLAKVTDQFCLIRSMSHPKPIANHFDAMHNMLSGQVVERVEQGRPDDLPYLGSVVANHLPSERNLVSNAWLIKCVGPPVFCAPNIGSGGYLGSAYAPVFIGSETNHPAMPDFKPPEIYDMGDPARLWERRQLLSSLESDRLAGNPVKDWSDLRELAYDAMTRPEGRQAFALDREPLAVRERYGMHPLGQNLLLARRMAEAGVRFITVNGWVGPAPGEKAGGPPSSSWDMHGGHMGMGNAFGTGSYGMNFCLPRLDQGLSALLSDLKDRGMLDDTLVVAVGEFGRSPVIQTKGEPGRVHWPGCFSAIMAGGGIRGGAIYGESDKTGSAPVSNPVTPQDLHATILHALGVPLTDMARNTGISRPPFSTGKPVMGLFG